MSFFGSSTPPSNQKKIVTSSSSSTDVISQTLEKGMTDSLMQNHFFLGTCVDLSAHEYLQEQLEDFHLEIYNVFSQKRHVTKIDTALVTSNYKVYPGKGKRLIVCDQTGSSGIDFNLGSKISSNISVGFASQFSLNRSQKNIIYSFEKYRAVVNWNQDSNHLPFSLEKFKKILENIGTHYVHAVSFGGYATYHQVDSSTSSSAAVKLDSGLLGEFGITGQGVFGSKQFVYNSSPSLSGDPTKLDFSIKGQPDLYSFTLVPIWKLFQTPTRAKAEFEKFIENKKQRTSQESESFILKVNSSSKALFLKVMETKITLVKENTDATSLKIKTSGKNQFNLFYGDNFAEQIRISSTGILKPNGHKLNILAVEPEKSRFLSISELKGRKLHLLNSYKRKPLGISGVFRPVLSVNFSTPSVFEINDIPPPKPASLTVITPETDTNGTPSESPIVP